MSGNRRPSEPSVFCRYRNFSLVLSRSVIARYWPLGEIATEWSVEKFRDSGAVIVE